MVWRGISSVAQKNQSVLHFEISENILTGTWNLTNNITSICKISVLSLGYAILTITITEAFGLPKPSLSSNYKVMLFLCCLRVNWIQNVTCMITCIVREANHQGWI